MFRYDAGLVAFKKFSQPAVNNFPMVYFNPTTYSWNEILGPVLGKIRNWGWGTVFDLVPFFWGGVNKHV